MGDPICRWERLLWKEPWLTPKRLMRSALPQAKLDPKSVLNLPRNKESTR